MYWRNKPFWEDGCQHGEDCYVGSFRTETEKIDVYLYTTLRDHEICLRFGNDCHEYYSPGPLLQFLNLDSNSEGERTIQAQQLLLQRVHCELVSIRRDR